MVEGERDLRDKRKWHTSKEIPLSVVYSAAVLLVTIGVSYESLRRDISSTKTDNAQLTAALKETNLELRALTKQFQEGSVPTAQLSWRVQAIETERNENKARIAELERQGAAREQRLQRLESSLNATNARARAREDR